MTLCKMSGTKNCSRRPNKMLAILRHLIIAFIVATQLGCTVRILTWNDASVLDRDYDVSAIKVIGGHDERTIKRD